MLTNQTNNLAHLDLFFIKKITSSYTSIKIEIIFFVFQERFCFD